MEGCVFMSKVSVSVVSPAQRAWVPNFRYPNLVRVSALARVTLSLLCAPNSEGAREKKSKVRKKEEKKKNGSRAIKNQE